MSLSYVSEKLKGLNKTWLVTGAAGFIGSNITHFLLTNGQKVVGLDNFATGLQSNLDEIKETVNAEEWENFSFIEGDIRNFEDCEKACDGADLILHQGALGSVPRSIKDPLASHQANVDGFINILWAAQKNSIKRVVYASSSSVYGDHPDLPKVEGVEGNILSPYAATKKIDEEYAAVFGRTYGMETLGLRYFNVFGRFQRPDGPYAAVIPKWIGQLLEGQDIEIYGDGKTSRDFCYVKNVIQANLLAAMTEKPEAFNKAYNIACGSKTSLTELHKMIVNVLEKNSIELKNKEAVYKDFRAGDIKHSLADVSRATELIGYSPEYSIDQGLEEAVSWYIKNLT